MADRPHIVFIITDQQRFDTINALGFDFVDTPHLDRLVHEGVAFTNQFITAASCAPARASLFTGYYPHTHGVLANADLWRHSWIEDLGESGYRCTNVGKMHSYPYDTPLGFAERYVVENKDRYMEERWYFDEWDKGLRARGLVKQQRELYRQRPDYAECLGAFLWELPADLHSDNFVGDMAVWWLDTKPKKEDQPLFLEIGFPGPHPPYDPTAEWADKYIDRDIPLLEVTQDELDNQPQPLKTLRKHNSEVDHDSVVHQLNPSREARHRQRAYYLANVSMIDQKVGEIIEALDRNGYLENCIVIFSSDHGDCLTDHGHSQKWTMYDTITKVPTIVWTPDGRFGKGKKIDGLNQQMDLGPMILDLAGVEVDKPIEAKSLLPALEGSDWQERDYVFAEQGRDNTMESTDFMTMVRSRDWKLVHFLDEPWGQLFDLNADPDEVVNLWDSPEHADKKQELLGVLREWRIRSAYDTKDVFAEYR